MVNISNRLEVILDLKGWTQTELAKKAGIDEAHLNRIVKGQLPRLDTAFRICGALKLPINKVFITEGGKAA